MRKLIALILITASMSVNGQSITPVNGNYLYTGDNYFNKGLFIPVLDTVSGFVYRVGAQRIRPADTVGHPLTVPVYVWTGRRWMNAVGSGGGSYTAGNGLTLSGSEFRLGGSLSVGGTEIVTGGNTFGLNTGIPNAPTMFIGNGISKIGNYEPNGSFAGYFYVPDFGRGKNQFWMKGQPVLSYDYLGLALTDTVGTPVANINVDGSIRLKQPNGNYYLDAGINKFLTMNTGDTVFYADDTRAQFRALANTDPLKVLATDAFGAIQLVTSPSANTIYTSDGSITDERIITGVTNHGISWNDFNSYGINVNDGAGGTANYGFYPYAFVYSWNPPGEPTSNIQYNSGEFNVSLNSASGYNANTSENSQNGQGYSIYQKSFGAVTNTERIELQQGFSSDSSIFSIKHYKTNWSGDPGKLFDLDSFGTVKLKKYVNNSTQDSVLSTDQFGRLKLKNVLLTDPHFWGLGTARDTSELKLETDVARGRFTQSVADTLSVDGENDATYLTHESDYYAIEQNRATFDAGGSITGDVYSNSTVYRPDQIITSIQRQPLGTSYIYSTSITNAPESINLLYSYNPNSSGIGTAKTRSLLLDSIGTKSTGILRADSIISSGKISGSVLNAYNTSSANFKSYYHLSHDGADTSKKAWSIGMMGTPSTSGPTTPTGDSLKFRSCNNSGVFYTDVMTLTRQGSIFIPGVLTLGNVNSSAQQLLVNGSVNIVRDMAVRGITNYNSLKERGTVTVTGDYTVTNNDLYINVNNTVNCTITLTLPGTYSTYHIKKISNNAATVTIVGPNGTELIDGSTSLVLLLFNDKTYLHEDGTSYFTY